MTKTTITETAKHPVIVVPAAVVFGILGMLGFQQASNPGPSAMEETRIEMREDMATLKANVLSADKNLAAAAEGIKSSNEKFDTLTANFDQKFDRLNTTFDKLMVVFSDTRADIRILESRVGRMEVDQVEIHSDLKALRESMIKLREENPPVGNKSE